MSVYIVDPSNARAATCGLMKGVNYFRARRVKNGPYVAVKTQVIEPRDSEDNLCGDVQYIVEIDGQVIPFEQWDHSALFGDPIDEPTYRTMLADGLWTQANYGARPGEKTDVRKMPFVEP